MSETMRADVVLPLVGSAVHFVGIGGAGMIGLARILLAQGYRVTGSDRGDSPGLATLRELGATVHVGHDATYVGDAALVVISAAVRDENVEVAAARARGVPIVKRAALLGALANARRCIAVAGSHGKSTTSGMIAYILSALGHDPLFVVGAEVRDLGTSARNGAGPLAVVEADEYDYSFLHLTPDIAVITNIEHDHPDIFPTVDAYLAAFARFAGQTRDGGTIIIGSDDPNAVTITATMAVQTVGAGPTADWRIIAEADGTVTLTHRGTRIGRTTLTVAGEHNARNAAMAVAACAAVGVDADEALRVVAAYRGVGRRFEVVGETDGVTVIDDYAHHPTEVRATLAAARTRYPGRRIVAVFQPHTFSRSILYAAEFAAALSDADVAFVTDIYAAREPDPGTIDARDIATAVTGGCGIASGDLAATVARIMSAVKPGDVGLTLGAGDITTVGPQVLRLLQSSGVAR
ncbi:MAG: UDP-N-acetylmuramate--L-alanine ligase [Chloroflexota bacterium]|nr:UDP-N-acetylmuramate--L-alanine ligase [Chloroflexota bacterium]